MTDGSRRDAPQRRRTHQGDAFPTFDEIARRAHELFVAEGRPVDRVFDCWARAESELLERAARRVIR
jgi:hypothetical protein